MGDLKTKLDVADAEQRTEKFIQGDRRVTSDRWTAKPDIAECWRGDYRDWHIEATRYSAQLYCRFWELFINPSGHTCSLCKAGRVENWYSTHLEEALSGLDNAALITLLEGDRRLNDEQRLEIAERLNLTDVVVEERVSR